MRRYECPQSGQVCDCEKQMDLLAAIKAIAVQKGGR